MTDPSRSQLQQMSILFHLAGPLAVTIILYQNTNLKHY